MGRFDWYAFNRKKRMSSHRFDSHQEKFTKCDFWSIDFRKYQFLMIIDNRLLFNFKYFAWFVYVVWIDYIVSSKITQNVSYVLANHGFGKNFRLESGRERNIEEHSCDWESATCIFRTAKLGRPHVQHVITRRDFLYCSQCYTEETTLISRPDLICPKANFSVRFRKHRWQTS